MPSVRELLLWSYKHVRACYKLSIDMQFAGRTLLRVGLLLLIGGLYSCAPSDPDNIGPAEVVTRSELFPTATSAIAAESVSPALWQQISEPFTGVVLHGISEDSPPSVYIRDVLAPAFAQDSGILVDLEITDNQKIEETIAAGGLDYDFVYIEQDVIYGYLEKQRLVNLTELLDIHSELRSPVFNLIDFTGFIREFIEPSSGDLYGVPIEAFIKPYLYRTDLFHDPTLQKAFADRYHYPLAPAVTFQQYRDIAEFFTDYGQRSELPLWGTTVQATTTGQPAFYEFFETIAPAFGIYYWGINLDTNSAASTNGGQLDSPRAIEALTYWIDLLQFAPPEATASGWDEVAASFAAGRTAQAWVYGENMAWIATDAGRSYVVGKVGVALPPTAPGVMEAAIVGSGYLGYYDGAAFGIPINSQQKEAALIWLQYLGQTAVQPDWASASGRVVHFSTFDNGLIEAQDRRLNGYYSLMKEHGNLFAGAPPFPFHTEVRDMILPYIHQAIRQEISPDEALRHAAQAVDQRLLELGYRGK